MGDEMAFKFKHVYELSKSMNKHKIKNQKIKKRQNFA